MAQWPASAVQTAVLTWSPSSDTSVVGYKIYYATTYDLANTESVLSEEIVVVTKKAVVIVPEPPVVIPQLSVVANLTAVTNAFDPHSLTLSWDTDNNPMVAGYRIYWGTNTGKYYVTFHVGSVTSLVLTGLVENTTNYFMIRQRDDAWNEGPISSESSCFLAPVAKLANVPPTLDFLTNLTINMNASTQTVALTGISCGDSAEGQMVKISAVSSNPKLIAVKAINYTSPNPAGTLVFKPVANATGAATITVTVNDGGAQGNVTTQSFNITVINQAALAAMPKITRQLTDTVALPDQKITLGVGVSGKAPFKYQWKCNGINIAGATSATLTFKKLKLAQAGRYSVLVSNSAGVTNSLAASVIVVTNPAPTITMTPQIAGLAAKYAFQGSSGGQLGVQIDGVTGAKYVVQGSSDLKNWTSLVTNSAPFNFSEANTASYPQRYYRSYYQT
jgi:hypothetical protein